MIGKQLTKFPVIFFLFVSNILIAAPRLEQSIFNSGQENQTLLHLTEAGNYSLNVKSKQGTKISLIDQVAGPLAKSGVIGKTDGRLDLVLDQGTYKVRLFSPEKGQGKIELKVKPFKEVTGSLRQENLPTISDLELVQSSLKDLEQYSSWVYLNKREFLYLEAQGRNLESCKLWTKDRWLIETKFDKSIYEPVSGRPMRRIELWKQLPKGLYQVQCYGGSPLKWANENNTNPFYLRRGIPKLGINGIQKIKTSPFGRDFFLLPSKVDFFQISREKKENTRLKVKTWNFGKSLIKGWGREAEINKKSRNARAEIKRSFGSRYLIASVRAEPGSQLMLRHFDRDSKNLNVRAGRYWISSIQDEEGEDSLDLNLRIQDSKRRLFKQQVLELSSNNLKKRFNLNSTLEQLVFIRKTDNFLIKEISGSTAEAKYIFYPLKSRKNFRPKWVRSGSKVTLASGYYRLKIAPISKGILNLSIEKAGIVSGFMTGLASKLKLQKDKNTPAGFETGSRGIIWSQVRFSRSSYYYRRMYNNRPGVDFGMIARKLPLNLEESLPLYLMPGQSVKIEAYLNRDSKLHLEKDQKASFSLKDGFRTVQPDSSVLRRGKKVLTLKNTGKNKALFVLSSKAIQAKYSANQIRRELNTKFNFPILNDEKTVYQNFRRNQERVFELKVTKPGLYRLETTGRLATGIKLQTRFNLSLFNQRENGIGRNALVQEYFKPGDYRVIVRPYGLSRGRAGIQLKQAPLFDGGILNAEKIKRASLRPDQALRYQLEIPEAGEYQIETSGLSKAFKWRLEDAEGWPILKPGKGKIHSVYLIPGKYYYYSLPEPLDSRRVTLLNKRTFSQGISGEKLTKLKLNTTIFNLWRESAEREEDVYTFELTAPLDLKFELTKGFDAKFINSAEQEIAKTRLATGEKFPISLKQGKYKILVKSIDENDKQNYQLKLSTNQLAPGLKQSFNSAKANLDLKIGKESFIQIYSQGKQDIRAELLDKAGSQVAYNDDRKDDWNFSISTKLKAGDYKLKLEKAGIGYGIVNVFAKEKLKQKTALQQLPFNLEEAVQDQLFEIPFSSSKSVLLRVSINSGGKFGLNLFDTKGLLAEGENKFFIPIQAGKEYSLLCWQKSDSAKNFKLKAEILSMEEKELESDSTIYLSSSSNDRAFKMIGEDKVSYLTNADYYCPALYEVQCKPMPNSAISFNSGKGWLVTAKNKNDRIKVTPLTLKVGQEVHAELAQTPLGFRVENPNNQIILLEAKTAGVEIGANLNSNKVNWQAMVRNQAEVLALATEASEIKGQVWLTKKSSQPERVTLKIRSFEFESELELNPSQELNGSLAPKKALKIKLENNSQSLNINLTKGGVIALVKNGKAGQMLAAVNSNQNGILSSNGEYLTLVNKGDKNLFYQIEQLSTKNSEQIVNFDSEKVFEKIFRTQNKLELNLGNIPIDKKLFISGDQVRASLLLRDGKILTGTEFLINSELVGAKLELPASHGLVQVWVAAPERKELIQAGLNLKDNAENLELKNGKAILKNKAQLETFKLNEISLVRILAESPGLTALIAKNKVLDLVTGDKKRELVALLNPGEYQILTRPIKGIPQFGKLKFEGFKLKKLQETSEPKQIKLIAPGNLHAYQFSVQAKDANVGTGISAEAENLNAVLYDHSFRQINNGALMLQKLKEGNYFLVVKNNTIKPVSYSPVLYGSKGSKQKVPMSVQKQYTN